MALLPFNMPTASVGVISMVTPPAGLVEV